MKNDLNTQKDAKNGGSDEHPFLLTSELVMNDIEPSRALGDFIREVRALSDEEVSAILEHQGQHGLKFGEAAIALRLASPEQVRWALAQQYHYPYASRNAANFSDELVAAKEPFGARAEEFRALRSQLLAAPIQHDRPLAVVSAEAGVGKSYVCANLAVSFSQLGERTLLIDANLRSPRQHAVFHLPSQPGLGEMLAGRCSMPALHRIAELPSLYVLPAGSRPPNPLELVQRSAFRSLLAGLVGQFQHIIVDTPPASLAADAQVIAGACGVAMAIGLQDKTRMADLQQLLTALRGRKVQLAGVTTHSR
jgi:chain length determinant protein tyrosine kinase EpsG